MPVGATPWRFESSQPHYDHAPTPTPPGDRRRRRLALAGVRKPAVVLDIDETSLSNLGCLKAAGYELIGLATCAVNKRGTAARGPRP